MAHRIGKIQGTKKHAEAIGVSTTSTIPLYGTGGPLSYEGGGMHHKITLTFDGGGTITLSGTNTLENSLNGGLVTGASISSGDLLINTEDIGAVTVLATDSNSALRNAINAKTGDNGVVATLNKMNQLVLTHSAGTDIVIAGSSPSVATDLSAGTQSTWLPLDTLTAAGTMSTGDLNSPAYKYYRVTSDNANASSFTVLSFSSLIPSP
jgi:hypothetical protein